jgi:hypothetical protein
VTSQAPATDNVWVCLVERDLERGGDLSIYTTEAAALGAAVEYIHGRWDHDVALPANAVDILNAYNDSILDEHVIVDAWRVRQAQ